MTFSVCLVILSHMYFLFDAEFSFRSSYRNYVRFLVSPSVLYPARRLSCLSRGASHERQPLRRLYVAPSLQNKMMKRCHFEI